MNAKELREIVDYIDDWSKLQSDDIRLKCIELQIEIIEKYKWLTLK